MSIIIGVCSYLLVGIIVLLLINKYTGNRISNNLAPASYETQDKLAQGHILTQGTPILVSMRLSKVITTIALWILWPVAVIGVVKSALVRGDKHGKQ